jgi:hypothetical protein
MTPEGAIIESMFRVVDKEGNDRDFILNPTQRKLDELLTGRDLIPKARQEGVSTYFLARYTAACLMKRNVKAVVISHEGKATQRLLSRCQYFLKNIRGGAAIVGRDSMNAITFPKMDSTIYIGTAGSKTFGRGDTVTHCHCSEYAYWQNPKGLLGGLLQAVPMSGEVAIESTGNGVGNDYHRRVMRAHEGLSEWACHFFNWVDFPEYSVILSPEDEAKVLSRLNPYWDEPRLVAQGMTAGQIIWRRIKLEELDYDLQLFSQEYPLTLDECFQASGSSLFAKVRFMDTREWVDTGNNLHILNGHPCIGSQYTIGVDPSGGVGKDNAVIQIFHAESGEQVAEYAHNRIEPDTLGVKAAELGRLFNEAYITVESNNHGPVTLDALRDEDYPQHLIYSMESAGSAYEDKTLMQLGFRTSVRTKPIMLGKLRTLLAKTWTIHSTDLKSELSTFIEHEDGKLAAQDGCKDDRVMAAACAAMGAERAMLYSGDGRETEILATKDPARYPFTLEGIIGSLSDNTRKGGLKPQHASSSGNSTYLLSKFGTKG